MASSIEKRFGIYAYCVPLEITSATAEPLSAVALVISKGTQYAYIPNLFSIEEAKAVQALKDLELKVVVKKIGKKAVKKVTNISPKVGSKVKRGSTVTITVG